MNGCSDLGLHFPETDVGFDTAGLLDEIKTNIVTPKFSVSHGFASKRLFVLCDFIGSLFLIFVLCFGKNKF